MVDAPKKSLMFFAHLRNYRMSRSLRFFVANEVVAGSNPVLLACREGSSVVEHFSLNTFCSFWHYCMNRLFKIIACCHWFNSNSLGVLEIAQVVEHEKTILDTFCSCWHYCRNRLIRFIGFLTTPKADTLSDLVHFIVSAALIA